MFTVKNYVDGQLIPSLSGRYLENIDPAEGKVYAMLPDSDERDVDLAVQGAKTAFAEWSAMPAGQRSALLHRVADLIDRDLEKLALAESKDTGKPLKLARTVDIPRASANFRFFASAIINYASESHVTEGKAVNYTTRGPVGIAGCISPWNLPLYLFTWKIAPALAAGNCVIAKPSEVTPVTAGLLSELCMEAGLPRGVLQVIHGTGPKAGQAIVNHKDIPVISFTGGTLTGKRIAATAAPMFKKLSLELGGKNPNIIYADCDFDQALHTAIQSSFSNQGQICLCGSRIFVERAIYNTFKNAFVERTRQLTVGDPLTEGVDLGALVSGPHLEKVLSYVTLAKKEGGEILTGGERVNPGGRCTNGYFMAPAIIEGLPYNCRTNLEEIFGPVVTIMPFDSDEEVIQYANATEYGLSATLWTRDLSRAHQVSHALKSGIVWVNCWLLRDLRTPFGGMKQSGIGREGGLEALRFFTEPRNICIKL